MKNEKSDRTKNVQVEHDVSSSIGTAMYGVRCSLAPLLSSYKAIKGSHPIVRKPRLVPSRFTFSHVYCFYLMVIHLFPRYLYHFLRRPYCQDLPAMDYEFSLQSSKYPPAEPSDSHTPRKVGRRFTMKKHRRDRPADAFPEPPQKLDATRGIRAYYDAMLSLALDGYVELTGTKLAPGSGQVVFLLFELARSLDEYLDQQLLAGTSPAMYEVLEVPEIQEQIALFFRHLEPFGCAMPILKHLRQLFVTYYDPYVKAFLTAKKSLQFEDALEVAKIDTGIWCRIVMEVVCLFNEHQIDYELLNDFYLFGMIGKFADDIVDLVSDIEKGLPNLLYTLIRQHPEECAHLELAIKSGERLTMAWCKKRCPLTYRDCFKQIEHSYQQIRSSKVRSLSLLMFAPPSSVICALD